MSNVYIPLLKTLKSAGLLDIELVGFTTRTEATADTLRKVHNDLHFFKKRDDLAKEADALLICVNATASNQVIDDAMTYRMPLLVETPIADHDLVKNAENRGVSVSVIEQWPFLPLEQFKELLFNAGIIERPYYALNDCRSYDYHAIAQLRSYIGKKHMPTTVVAASTGATLVEHEALGGGPGSRHDRWDLGTITFSNGAVIQHNFSYCCKTAPFRSGQLLRSYSSNGTIMTGRLFERENDYDVVNIHIANQRDMLNVSIDRVGTSAAKSISIDGCTWINPYANLDLSDGDVAIATHLSAFANVVKTKSNPLYTIKDTQIDYLIIQAVKYAASIGKAVVL